MIGQTISYFRILEKLSEGGMGVVFGANDLILKRNIARRFFPSRVVSTPDEKKCFTHEAQLSTTVFNSSIAIVSEPDEDPSASEKRRRRLNSSPTLIELSREALCCGPIIDMNSLPRAFRRIDKSKEVRESRRRLL